MPITAIRGFRDILPYEIGKWQFLEGAARDIFHLFGFKEIRTPLLEKTELFSRAIGEATDIVEKEMYTFIDRNGESITLRPEATASVLRALIENNLHVQDKVQKIYTIGPMFRHERPQKGRYRQFYQISAESIGQAGPGADAEVVDLAVGILNAVGVTGLELQVNSLGCLSCRPTYREKLKAFLEEKKTEFCLDCQRRTSINPLRVLDCKLEGCRSAISDVPLLLESLCRDCEEHFEELLECLSMFEIPFKVNPLMVRGLDYYTRTTFEITSAALGSQNAVAAGGRYDGLIRDLGGPELSGIGFAIGMERLSLLMDASSIKEIQPVLFIIALGDMARGLAGQVLHRIRSAGIRAEMDYEPSSLKSQMRRANRAGAHFALIVGDKELEERSVTMKNMRSGRQWPVALEGDMEKIARIICEEVGRSCNE